MGFFKFRKNQDAPCKKSSLLTNDVQLYADAYRTLAANIEHVVTEQRLSSLLVTSAIGGEGKTTVAVNLGLTLSKEGKKILVVNTDAHNRDFNELFDIPADVSGISECLNENIEANVNEQIVHLKELRLDALPYGTQKDIPIGQMIPIIDQLKTQYDLVILLSSAVNAYPDTALLSKGIDGTLLVVKQNGSTAEEVSAAIKELQLSGANLIGTVFSHFHTLRDRKALKKYKRLYQ